MNIKKIEGLKYPDEYLIKFFFKNELFKKKSNVIEFGCGNGNNLSLFFDYEYKVVGIDNNKDNIKKAIRNFKKKKMSNNFKFLKIDMFDYIKTIKKINSKIIVFCNSIYYLDYKKIEKILDLLQKKTSNKTLFFFRVRLDTDGRKRLSKKIKKNTYRIKSNITNEKNFLITFFKEKNFIDLIKKKFGGKKIYKLKSVNENSFGNKIISNNDLIVWFRS
jgi:SAM-dependent methyltransferase